MSQRRGDYFPANNIIHEITMTISDSAYIYVIRTAKKVHARFTGKSPDGTNVS